MKILLKHEEIVEISKQMAEKITKNYANSNLVMVCVLKGACPFHSELIKHINLDMLVDYIQVKSYDGRETSGNIEIKKDLDYDISGKDVIVVEDIVDTGLTLTHLKKELEKRNPKSLAFATLLNKPSRRKVDFSPDYVGKTIDNLFVYGFGLDLDEKCRNLKDIYVVDDK